MFQWVRMAWDVSLQTAKVLQENVRMVLIMMVMAVQIIRMTLVVQLLMTTVKAVVIVSQNNVRMVLIMMVMGARITQ